MHYLWLVSLHNFFLPLLCEQRGDLIWLRRLGNKQAQKWSSLLRQKEKHKCQFPNLETIAKRFETKNNIAITRKIYYYFWPKYKLRWIILVIRERRMWQRNGHNKIRPNARRTGSGPAVEWAATRSFAAGRRILYRRAALARAAARYLIPSARWNAAQVNLRTGSTLRYTGIECKYKCSETAGVLTLSGTSPRRGYKWIVHRKVSRGSLSVGLGAAKNAALKAHRLLSR